MNTPMMTTSTTTKPQNRNDRNKINHTQSITERKGKRNRKTSTNSHIDLNRDKKQKRKYIAINANRKRRNMYKITTQTKK